MGARTGNPRSPDGGGIAPDIPARSGRYREMPAVCVCDGGAVGACAEGPPGAGFPGAWGCPLVFLFFHSGEEVPANGFDDNGATASTPAPAATIRNSASAWLSNISPPGSPRHTARCA